MSTEPWALKLGYAGLLPFGAGALLSWLVYPDVLPYVLATMEGYAALIVSFLGGIHWAFGMLRPDTGPRRFLWAVAPMLLAWCAVIMPPYAGLVVLGVLLVACYLVDRTVYPELGLQAWLTLRFRLTVVAALSCFIAAGAA